MKLKKLCASQLETLPNSAHLWGRGGGGIVSEIKLDAHHPRSTQTIYIKISKRHGNEHTIRIFFIKILRALHKD